MMVNIFIETYPIIQCLIERMKDGILEEIDVTQVLQIFAEMLSPQNIFGPEMASKNFKPWVEIICLYDSLMQIYVHRVLHLHGVCQNK